MKKNRNCIIKYVFWIVIFGGIKRHITVLVKCDIREHFYAILNIHTCIGKDDNIKKETNYFLGRSHPQFS